ncbi:MAG TPA: FAD-dependent oxidoreductase [Bacteroidales bacterium]|nr:FAD-dependent oxidoreductase [Bacteroidales bacterium]HRZ21515.1 FAD-dependent oxidoreductase [Bacteroidales bacterium]
MTTRPLLIIGGGISGITAAVEAAEAGMEVILVEKQPYLGGRVARLSRYFPKLCPPQCGLEINYRRIRNSRNIHILTSSTVDKISGTKGNFTVRIERSAQYVNNLCTACGECPAVCPVERPDEFYYGTRRTKAIFIPDEITVPFRYTIDGDVCLKAGCAECLSVCKYQAIDLYAQPETITREISGVILATGWKPYDAGRIPELGFGSGDRIVTNVMLERLPVREFIVSLLPARSSPVIAFAQCTGSRDRNHLPYCSGICCGTTLKQALMIREQLPESRIKIFFIDLRVQGRNEDVLTRVLADPNIELIKGKMAGARIQHNDGLVEIEAEDILNGRKIRTTVDLLVLATGMVPEQVGLDQVRTLDNGYIDRDSLPDGFFAVGNALHPADVPTSVKEATAAALKGLQVVRSTPPHPLPIRGGATGIGI